MLLEEIIVSHLERGDSLALATIVQRTGSAPRHTGSRMIVAGDLSVTGSIGGGLPEAEALAAAFGVRQGAPAQMLYFDMTDVSPTSDMICGGTIDVLIEQITPQHLAFFQQALTCRRKAAFGVWTVDLTSPSCPQRAFYSETALHPSILAQVSKNSAACIELDGRRVYVEPLIHQGVVVLCGGGHVSLATGRLAREVGFEIVVVDDREEFASRERFPFARAVHVLPHFADLVETCGIGPEHYVVIATRGHSHDRECLGQAMHSPARYVGMIGSRRKRDRVFAFLREEGFSEPDLVRVHSPIGVEIGAETPEEIAISIVAELIAIRHGLPSA